MKLPKNSVAKGMVGDLAQALVLIGRHSDDVEDKRSLRLRSHHAVQRRQFTESISGREHGRPPHARVAIRGV